VNTVQQVPAQTPEESAAGQQPQQGQESAAPVEVLPTAVTLPTAAPTPEPTVDRSQPISYVVQNGDVLGLIAEQFDVDIAELRRANGLDGNLIRVGQELTIPAESSAAAPATSDSSETASDAPAAPAPTRAPAARVTCNAAATGHCIQPGESLLGIALQYDVTVEQLRAANPGVSGDLIQSGQVLNLPGSGTASPAPSNPAPSNPAPADLTPTVVATVGPRNDADCEARNREFPYFHAADGLCYANPIGGGTAVPTVAGGNDLNNADADTCDPGFFLWEDGLCYRIPGATVVPTTPTATTTNQGNGFGFTSCEQGFVVDVATNECVRPEATATATAN